MGNLTENIRIAVKQRKSNNEHRYTMKTLLGALNI